MSEVPLYRLRLRVRDSGFGVSVQGLRSEGGAEGKGGLRGWGLPGPKMIGPFRPS